MIYDDIFYERTGMGVKSCTVFFSYIMGKKVKNSKYTNTVYTLTLVVMKEGVSRDYIYKLIIQNKYRQTRGD